MRTGCRYSIWFATDGQDDSVLLCAFDLLEVNGEDIRQDGIEGRKRRLAGLLRRPHDGMALNEHYRGDGAVIFKHACAWVVRALSRSDWAHRIGPVARRIGLRSRTRMHRQ
jgi:hypothetical protein